MNIERLSEKILGKVPGGLRDLNTSIVSVKIIAIVLLAVFIPSLLITALGLFAVYRAEPILRERFEYPVKILLERLEKKLVKEWDLRLQRYAERLPLEPDLHHFLLSLPERDPHIRDVFLFESDEFVRLESGSPFWKLVALPGDPAISRAWDLEYCKKDFAEAEHAYRLLLRGGTPEQVVEALTGLARIQSARGEWKEAIQSLKSLVDRFGYTLDLSGIPRGIPALWRIIEISDLNADPVVASSHARELKLFLERHRTWLDDELVAYYQENLNAFLQAMPESPSKEPAELLSRMPVSRLLSREDFRDRLRKHARGALGQNLGYFRVPLENQGYVILAFVRLQDKGRDRLVYLELNPSAYLDDVHLFTRELQIPDELLRFPTGEGMSKNRLARRAQALVSRPFPRPFQHLSLQYIPTRDQVSQHLQRLETLKTTGFTWAIIVLVLTIFLGILITLRSILQEMQVSKIKSDFVSFVTHELKTPLTAIQMFTEMLLLGRAKGEEEQEKCVELIDKEVARLSRLIQQILEFAKIERHQQVFHFTSCDLGEVVREAARIFKEHNSDENLEVEINQPQHISRIRMDRSAMTEVILNLLSNAHKYSREKSHKIVINLRESIDNIYVEVVDFGIGIPKREQRKIFEKFYRAQDYLTREIEGTGLGLTFAKYIAKVHNGDIKVTSSLNQGSTFTLEIRKNQVLAE